MLIHRTASILFLGFFFSWVSAVGQSSTQLPLRPDGYHEIVIIQPTGDTIDGLIEMRAIPDTAQLYRSTLQLIANSFVQEMVELYYYLQVFLVNNGERKAIEPAYLALTQNQGGFARFGFYLRGEGPKPQSPYVDIIEKTIHAPQDKLMSLTQLYPHEMGHVFYRLLSSDSTLKEDSKTVDMHYFSVITDYGIAFDEGFAEHIENAARLFEPNDSLKEGIFADIRRAQKKQPLWIRGFKNDFQLPFRLGYYKATMVLWFQRMENLRRYEQAMDGTVRFKNASLGKGRPEDRLSFRNSGVSYQSELRNRPQAMATEGVINFFFTQVLESDLPKRYLEPNFYKPFLYDTVAPVAPPSEWLSPVQNQFLKYFVVLHNYVSVEHSDRAQWIDFVEGYRQTFPEEWPEMKELAGRITGDGYFTYLPPPLWLMVKGHEHRLLAMDAFGAITVPVYTFDLNRAELEDLLTIDGMNEADARLLLNHRHRQGFFQSLEAAATVPGLSKQGQEALRSSAFDEAHFEAMSESNLNIRTLLVTPVKRLLLNAIPYLLFILFFSTLLFKGEASPKTLAWRGLRYTGLWLAFVIVGLAVLVLSGKPLLLLAVFWAFTTALAILAFRKNKDKLGRTIALLTIMAIFVEYSLW